MTLVVPACLYVAFLHLGPATHRVLDTSSHHGNSDIPELDNSGQFFIYDDIEFSYNDVDPYEEKYANIFKTFPNYENSSKYLIYFCDINCGGLGDRLKGIMKVYMLSVLTERRFGVKMTEPVDISNFLQPRVLNWTVDEAALAGRRQVAVDYKTLHDSLAIKYENGDLDPKDQLVDDVIFMRANQDWTNTLRKLKVTPARFPQIYTHPSSDLTRIIYHGLFKPVHQLNQYITDFFKDKVQGDKVACLHARMGEEQWQRYTFDRIKTPLEFLKKYDSQPGFKIMIATDDEGVRNYSRTYFDNFVDTDFTDSPHHIDYMQNNTVTADVKASGFMHALVDHHILRRCDVLVLTNSGFGVSAASLRSTSTGLYVLLQSGVYPVRREHLREVFQWRCVSRMRTSYLCDG